MARAAAATASRAVAGDEDGALGLERAGGGEGVGEQRRGGERVQHLGQVGVHPRALAGGEHDDGDGHAGLRHWRTRGAF